MKKYTKEELFKMDAVDVYKMVLRGDVIKTFPRGFWQQPEAKQNAAKCTRYLIEEILKYDEKTLKEKNSAIIFKKNKLKGMLTTCFNDSPYNVINNAYPNKFKEWEFNFVPNGFWEKKENRIKATKWLIEEKLKLSDDELKKQLSKLLFKESKLNGLLVYLNESPYNVINEAYPNKFKEWDFKNVPNNFWSNKENGIKATKWLIEEKLKLSDDEIKEQLSQTLFIKNGLFGMLSVCFNGSPYEAINTTYPNKFKEWDFKNVPNNFWSNKENGTKITKWLIEEKLRLSDDEIKEQLSQELFIKNGLGRMVKNCFNASPYEAINTTYPNKFKEWEFKNVPNNFWSNKENGTKATKWLIEEKLKLSDDEIKEQLSQTLFIKNGLFGMLSVCFNGSPYEAINSTYPNKYKEWEFKNVSMNFWNKENGIKAIKWLIEEKLKLSDTEVKEQFNQKLFMDNGLSGMLQRCFKGNSYEAINAAYPNKFKKSDFR